MSGKKLIMIGCDDVMSLSAILNNIKESPFFSPDIITATRVPDLAGLMRPIHPDLVVLCFRNSKGALNDLASLIKKPGIPILCLVRKLEDETLCWTPNQIVFTHPLDYISNKGYLNSRINSIFLAKNQSLAPVERTSLADTALQLSQSGNSRNLSRYVLELDQKVEFLLKVKDRIANLYPRVDDPVRGELMSIVNSIKMSANNDRLWEEFKVYFEQTNPDFLQSLVRKHPALTPIDLKYCCYLKMNMSNDDITNLLGIDQQSVRTHKYRLKKKMTLSKEEDLRIYLRSVG